MTMHIDLRDIKCSKCSVLFIPFKKDFKCPNCNESTNKFFDFIPKIIDSMKYHKQRYGMFMPPAWYIGSLAEHVQSIVFKIFDNLESNKPDAPKKFIIDFLKEVDWGNQQYLQKHIEGIALAVFGTYELTDFKINQETQEKKGKRSRGFWKVFLP